MLSCIVLAGLLTGCSEVMPPATPTFTPAAGTYSTAQVISISSTTAAATIYYTTDGSTPTPSSTKYSGPITVDADETLKAVAVTSGVKTSSVASAQYVLKYVTVSANSYAFPQNVVQNSVTQVAATVKNSAPYAVTLNTSISGDSSYTLSANASQACGAQLASGASCSIVVQYLPTAAGSQNASVQVSYGGKTSGSATVALSGTSVGAPAGSVAATTNPLVARYTITPQFGANVSVQFGTDMTYGRTTSVVNSASGGAVNLLVAGMRANTLYHMRASITYANGNTLTNADQTFTTGSLPSDLASLSLTVTTTPGMTPQPGVEMMNGLLRGPYQPYVVDLQGNVIWYYPWPDYDPALFIDGIKQMTNGDYIAVIGANSTVPLTSPVDPAAVKIREFDLEGKAVKELTLGDLNTKLAARGTSLVLSDFHHDITVLPNGHWLILANTIRSVQGQNVIGDVVVDVDTNLNPQFVWNEFDHFDTNRQPMSYPDWTHSNAVVYSPDDGNFLVSIRHQHWVVKVNYQNGAGDGSVLWRLGYQGDFTLVNGTSPIDWQYAQHLPSFVGTATAGKFGLTLMDNGNGRIVTGTTGTCGSGSNPPCYTTIPVFQIDESARTATVESRVTIPPDRYSNFGGNAEVLANNDLEYDLCGLGTGSEVDEVLPDSNHTLVWSLIANGDYLYRAFRLPSLYPNVQWP